MFGYEIRIKAVPFNSLLSQRGKRLHGIYYNATCGVRGGWEGAILQYAQEANLTVISLESMLGGVPIHPKYFAADFRNKVVVLVYTDEEYDSDVISMSSAKLNGIGNVVRRLREIGGFEFYGAPYDEENTALRLGGQVLADPTKFSRN